MHENDKILIQKLEELNKEYLDSGYYQLGKYISYLKNLIKQKRFIKFFEMILLHFTKKKKKQIPNEESISSPKYRIKNDNGYKIAIYTCITGDYDKVEEPLITEEGCDYFLFTNSKNITSDNWKIIPIPEEIQKLQNNAKINRYIKMHPKELFEGYDYSVYIDGNIKLISTISQFVRKINDKTGFAIHRHCTNECIFNEVKDCRAYGKGNYSKLKKQISRYKNEGFPKEYGMLECNVLVSNLKNENAKKIFDGWWNEYLTSESMRDQIALPYVLWKMKIPVEEIGNLGENVNTNSVIKINSHI